MERLCAHHDCPTNGKVLNTGTCRHCRHCGCETINVEELEVHKCQWKPEWAPLSIADKNLKIIAAYLVCTRNPSHATKTSTELLGTRAAGFTRFWDDYSAWIKNDSKGTDPRVTRPIVECQDCFKEIWPDGIYGEQKPGARMWPPGF